MILRALLLSALLAGLGAAQSARPAPSEKRNPEEIDKAIVLWHDRANAFTDAALYDGWRVGWLLSVLHARLAEAWWKDDPIRARSWMDGAVQDVTFERKNESDYDRKHHLQAAEAVFQVCERLKLDKEAQQVLDYLVEASKNGGPAARQGIASVAGSVMTAATDVASKDPDQALALGNKLIELHSGFYVLNVVDSLRVKRPQQADQLFEHALTSAVNSADYSSIYSLMQYPFPYFNNPVPPASEAVKTFTANTIGSFLAAPASNDEQQAAYCREATRIADHMLQYLAPAQQGIVQAAVQTCRAQPADETTKDQDAAGDVGPDDCKTTDACLKLADTAKTDERRARLKDQASAFAMSEQDPVRALEILNSLTLEEKEWASDWSNTYGYLSGEAMRKLYAQHDSHTMQRLIDDAPDDLRGQVILNLASSPEVRKDKPYAVTLLTEARATLEKFPTDNPNTYLGLMAAYSDVDPEDAVPVFGFVVKALNHITYPDLDKEREEQKTPGKQRPLNAWVKPGNLLEPVYFNASVLDQDEPYVDAAIKSLDDPETRIGFRLTCLRYSLKRYDQERKAREALSGTKH